MVAASTNRASTTRLIAALPCKGSSAGLWRGRALGLSQPRLGHARCELRHHRLPLGTFHPVPARDLRKRTSTAETEAGSGVDHTDCDARRFDAHLGIVKDIRWFAQAPRYKPVPALMIGLLRALRFSSDVTAGAGSGCRGGASSATGASADITGAGGE